MRFRLFAAVIWLASCGGGARAQECWYAVYLGGDHIGFSYVYDGVRDYDGVSCRYLKHVTEIHKGGLVPVDYRHEYSAYFDGRGLAACNVERDDAGVRSTVVGCRDGAGDLTFTVKKNGRTETRVFKHGEYEMTSLDNLTPELAAPGDSATVRIVDLEVLKVKKTKLQYVADASLNVNGGQYDAMVVNADTAWEKIKYWLAGDRHTAYRVVKNTLAGKITVELTTESGAKP